MKRIYFKTLSAMEAYADNLEGFGDYAEPTFVITPYCDECDAYRIYEDGNYASSLMLILCPDTYNIAFEWQRGEFPF